MADANIDELVARGDADALAQLADSPDKATAKAARRGLHLLRTRGLKTAAPVPAPKKTAPPARPASAEVPSLVSSYDPSGERAVWLARPDPGGGVLIYEAYVHEQNGVTAFRVSEASRKSYRKLVRDLLTEKQQFAVAEVPWDYARAQLEAAYQRNL